MPSPTDLALPTPTRSVARRAALAFVFLWFFIGGIAHFAATGLEMRIVPTSLPWPRAIVLASGALELLGGFGLLFPRSRQAAGIGLFLLTIAVTPANVYMLRHAALFGVPRWALVARLPLQGVLLALIAWSTFSRFDRPARSLGSRARRRPARA